MEGSKWLVGLAVLATIASVTAIDKDVTGIHRDEQFFKGYTATKMLMSCFGQFTVEKWQWTHQKYYYDCEREVRPFAPNKTRDTQPFHFKEYPFFDVRRIGHLRYHTDISVQVMRCVFQRLGLRVGMNGAVNTKAYRNSIKKSIKMEAELRHYVTHGINNCVKETFCGDYGQFGNEHIDILKLHEFYRCSMLSRLSACVKWDLGKNAANYDLHGLGPTLHDLYTNGRRFAASAFYSNSHLRGPFKYDL